MEGGDNGGGGAYGDNPDYADGIVHEFWLQGTVILALLEKDGKLTVIDDLSD